MKILHVVHSYPPAYRIGGPAISVSRLIIELERQRISENTVYATNLDLNVTLEVPLKKQTLLEKIKVYFFPITQINFNNSIFLKFINKEFKKWYFSISLIKKLFCEIKKFDIVHIHMPFIASSFATSVFCILFRVAYIISYRGCLGKERLKQNYFIKKIYINSIERFISFFAYSSHALTVNEANALKNLFCPRNIKVLPNCIDCNETGYNKRLSKSIPKTIRIIYLSRIERIKGPLFLSEVFHDYYEDKNKKCNIEIDFIGPLEQKFKIYNKKFLKKIKESKFMNYYGAKTGNQKKVCLENANFLILPSLSEGLPMTVLEALSQGMPVIITPNCNIPEIDLYNAGYIVNLTKKSLFQCFDKISNLSNSQYREMCSNAFKLCSDHFCSEYLAKKYGRYYENISLEKKDL